MAKITMQDLLNQQDENRQKVAQLDERISNLAADVATYMVYEKAKEFLNLL